LDFAAVNSALTSWSLRMLCQPRTPPCLAICDRSLRDRDLRLAAVINGLTSAWVRASAFHKHAPNRKPWLERRPWLDKTLEPSPAVHSRMRWRNHCQPCSPQAAALRHVETSAVTVKVAGGDASRAALGGAAQDLLYSEIHLLGGVPGDRPEDCAEHFYLAKASLIKRRFFCNDPPSLQSSGTPAAASFRFDHPGRLGSSTACGIGTFAAISPARQPTVPACTYPGGQAAN